MTGLLGEACRARSHEAGAEKESDGERETDA
jgi:hypothetical protein